MSQSSRISEDQFNSGPLDDSTSQATNVQQGLNHPLLKKAQNAGASMVSKIECTVQSRPLLSLGIAAGLGVLVAVWSKRK